MRRGIRQSRSQASTSVEIFQPYVSLCSHNPLPRPLARMGVFCPPLIPFLSLIKSRVRRPGPDSESASRIASQSVRVSGSPGFPSHGSESASGRVGPLLVRAMPFFPPECFSLLTVRCIPRVVGPSPGAGYRAGAGGTPPYSEVGRPAMWVRLPGLPRSAARSASQSTRAAGSSRSRQR